MKLVTSSSLGEEPYPFTRTWFRALCRDAKRRPKGAFRLPGRGGWAITVEDWEAYLRAGQPKPMSLEDEIRKRYVCAR